MLETVVIMTKSSSNLNVIEDFFDNLRKLSSEHAIIILKKSTWFFFTAFYALSKFLESR